MTYQKPNWKKYGLCIVGPAMKTSNQLREAIIAHDLVTAYLDNHPETKEKYEADQ